MQRKLWRDTTAIVVRKLRERLSSGVHCASGTQSGTREIHETIAVRLVRDRRGTLRRIAINGVAALINDR